MKVSTLLYSRGALRYDLQAVKIRRPGQKGLTDAWAEINQHWFIRDSTRAE